MSIGCYIQLTNHKILPLKVIKKKFKLIWSENHLFSKMNALGKIHCFMYFLWDLLENANMKLFLYPSQPLIQEIHVKPLRLTISAPHQESKETL